MKKEFPWKVVYEGFKPAVEGLREALCTLGNGYFGTRGAALESCASKIHYPATYLAGVYNKLATNISGRTIYNEDIVNCPNWTFITFRIGKSPWFLPSARSCANRYYSHTHQMSMGAIPLRVKHEKDCKPPKNNKRV